MRIRLLIVVAFAILVPGATAASSATVAEKNGAPGVSVERTTLAGTPAILRVPDKIERPPVILWHGLGPPGEKNALMAALPLDDVPAVKVYLDLPLFGERLPAGGLAELPERQSRDYGMEIFAPVVVGAAEELSAVVEALNARIDGPAEGGVSLFGFSAGGAAVLLAPAERDVRIRSAVVLNAPNGLEGGVAAFEAVTGSTYSWTDDARSVAWRTDASARAAAGAGSAPRAAVLLVHGLSDEVVSPTGAEAIERALRPFYEAAGEGAQREIDLRDGLEHHWAVQDAGVVDPLRRRVGDWLRRH
ncbi:MAG: alpha/beta hydrolase family protein [Parvularculaceae bacterium]